MNLRHNQSKLIINRFVILAAMLLTLVILALPAYAAGTGTIVVREISTSGGDPVRGISITAYKVASGNPYTGEAELTDAFSGYGYKVSDYIDRPSAVIDSTDKDGKTIDDKIAADKPSPAASGTSDANGEIRFDGLGEGVYYLMQTNEGSDWDDLGYSAEVSSSIVSVPYRENDGSYTYEVNCSAKCRIVRDDGHTDIMVEKHWQDDNDRSGLRPAKIEVGLYDGDKLIDTVWLEAANNWQYVWENLDEEKDWQVEEISVPAGYESDVEQEDTSFVITNSLTDGNPPPGRSGPKTGDSSAILIYAVLLALSGSMLLALAGRRRGEK